MKCSVCGKKIPRGAAACPYCSGNGGGFDQSFSGGFESAPAGNASFDMGGDSFGASPAPVQGHTAVKRSGSSGTLLLILLLLVLVGVAVYFQFFKGKTVERTQVAGFSAPSGHALQIGRNRWLLTNELLVTGDAGFSQADLERLLVDVDGAVVGYFPLINQYQVRFNIEDRAALDAVKARFERVSGIRRVDYNLKLTLTGESFSASPAAAPNVKIGLLDTSLSGQESFFLASRFFASPEALKEYLLAHPSAVSWDISAHAAACAAALGGSDNVLSASCFYVDLNDDGTLSLSATTGALRYQMACLVQAGAQVIAWPLVCPASLTDDFAAKEADLWDLALSALEAVNPSFLICKAGGEAEGAYADYLSRVLVASQRGKAHTLIVGAYREAAMEAADASGAGFPVYSASSAGLADVCARGGSDCEAAVSAAAYAARLHNAQAPSAEQARTALLSGAAALAARSDGTVLPAWTDGPSGAAAPAWKELAAVTVTAADSVTLQPVANAKVKVNGNSVTAHTGEILLVTRQGNVQLEAEAGGYASASWQGGVPEETSVRLAMRKNGASTGTIKGKVTLEPAISGSLTARITDRGTRTTDPDRGLQANYTLAMYPGAYDIEIFAYDRTPVTLYNVEVQAGQETQTTPITLSVPSDLAGKASGAIKDALTGNAVEGAALVFYSGVSAAQEGEPVGRASSGSGGKYTISLPGGTYTAFVTKEGYQTGKMTVLSVGEKEKSNQNCAITPKVPTGQIRIVLQWNDTPRDLDAHLANKSQNVHTYWPDAHKKAKINNQTVASLDKDDTQGNGFETTTIQVQLAGRYVFYVHDYTNRDSRSSSQMANSGATVTVYMGDSEPLVFNVPNQPGTLWEVFSLENGVITPSNVVTYHANTSNVGMQ